MSEINPSGLNLQVNSSIVSGQGGTGKGKPTNSTPSNAESGLSIAGVGVNGAAGGQVQAQMAKRR